MPEPTDSAERSPAAPAKAGTDPVAPSTATNGLASISPLSVAPTARAGRVSSPEASPGAAVVGEAIGGQVHSIDSALRLDRSRTERSTCYAEALERLTDGGRACVERIETELFGLRLRVGDCPRGVFHLPNSVFKGTEGQIWYHFSPKRRGFVLSYFHIDGRGGGLPIPRPTTLPGGICRSMNDDWADGIAARIAGSVAHSWSRERMDVDLIATIGLRDRDGHAEDPSQVVRDIVQTHCVMVHHDRTARLPDWSLLSRWSLAHEQLESPFARAIFAGEVMCRLGAEVGGGAPARALRLGPTGGRMRIVYHPVTASRLLDESRAILDAVRDNVFTDTLRAESSHFLTASLMDSDLMADDRRLALVRSELVFRLVMALKADAAETRSARRLRQKRGGSAQSTLPRRYALLSEFVRLSGGFFGRSGGSPNTEVVHELADCHHRERPLVTSMARSLLDFGCSTMLVVDLFSGPAESDWSKVDALSMGDMHARLSNIAGEILAPSETLER